ncbi:hypothetical protein EDC14_101271 [Hydrogenispora ethanolica]|uniref:Uncharacterized protein n=1 Tax=Hydrogenispora ethanolica TaxID=1082276 RepID=A0A4R1RSL5_HYDET|nr:hypothetical protein EDC14_101271 [Hydrogenispora ethanolica]
MIFLIKKVLLIGVVLGIMLFLMIPSGAAPTDVVLDQQVVLEVPGSFALVDQDNDKKAEAVNFSLNLQSYSEGNFIITGNLEGMRSGNWVSLSTSVIPFQWTPENRTVTLSFRPNNILKYNLSGPYRVTIGIKAGDWDLPTQVVGFSPKYAPEDFSAQVKVQQAAISSATQAKRAVETWASYKALRLGQFLGVSFNYDRWQVEYKEKYSAGIWRFMVSPEGSIESMKISPRNG